MVRVYTDKHISNLDCIIGSQLSVVNKLAVSDLMLPNTILILQLVSCCALLGGAHMFGLIQISNINRETFAGFIPLSVAFFGLLSAGMWVMKEAPLETFIAFKSTTPICFSIIDYLFLGRALPRAKSIMSMIGITLGAIYYVNGDVLSNAASYALCVVFIIFACLEGTIAKDTINRYKMNSWSRTFLMNLISIPIATGLALFTGELSHAGKFEDVHGDALVFSNRAVFALSCSCVFGVGMGVFTMLIRDALSATSVSVVATCNKFLSEIVNYFIWSNHASLHGAGAVFFIIFCGAFYEQSPLRKGEVGFSKRSMCPCLPRYMVNKIFHVNSLPKVGNVSDGIHDGNIELSNKNAN